MTSPQNAQLLPAPAKVGRPPKFKTPEEMNTLIEAYFTACDETKRPYTVPGLALALGFSSRSSLFDYTARNAGHEEFAATIKKAKLRIEAQRVEALVMCRGNAAGMIFDLKNNFGWRDASEVKSDATVQIREEDRLLMQKVQGLLGEETEQ
ncbi:MAG: hypothetical protein EOM69_03270 [Clostridia bacterium]|nr:hypothetical protein [Clostridia bacterium]